MNAYIRHMYTLRLETDARFANWLGCSVGIAYAEEYTLWMVAIGANMDAEAIASAEGGSTVETRTLTAVRQAAVHALHARGHITVRQAKDVNRCH